MKTSILCAGLALALTGGLAQAQDAATSPQAIKATWSNGVLQVIGTPADDRIEVMADSAGIRVNGGSVAIAGGVPTASNTVLIDIDAGAGNDRVSLEGVAMAQIESRVFGHEGTGGHSHLVYPWKTGQAQKFVVAVKPEGDHTTYSGWWFHPEKKSWMLIASFRAPKDGKYLRGLHSFSENFGGQNGHQPQTPLPAQPQLLGDQGCTIINAVEHFAYG